MKSKNIVTQIVISKLKRIENRNDFINVTLRMRQWLNMQIGFVGYSLYEDGINMSDRLEYDSIDSARSINDKFKSTEMYIEFMSLVEPTFAGFIGKAVNLDVNELCGDC